MKGAVVLLVAMVVMMGQTDAWRFWRTAASVAAGAIFLGKRDVEDADFKAELKTAAEDGVLTDEEIKSVFVLDDKGLDKFKETYDMNDDGTIQVTEYEAVASLAKSSKKYRPSS
ncbi:hypothetical protein LOTGIDRAFT_159175 [Lottia gigantea]|uniref:EF-hand domain-containing protein n=1 Tax=Lottia gigantea TaxID=225164 RepID=V4ATX9_LOTGI|nr:hypothetical protein LOTGIDRAFT_159175 [Lottia gigantea]ESO98370.1 hypothetical protein LOTGIDRAFT_159175 [Lottia gigantea]